MESLEEYIVRHKKKNLEKTQDFVLYLSNLLIEHGYTKDSDFYKKANIDRQTWHNIMSGKNVPTLNNLLKIIFTLKLDTHECKYLLKKLDITLASHSEYNLIIRYCIENKIYDIYTVNEYLTKHGFKIIE